jgi:hypothetical protein
MAPHTSFDAKIVVSFSAEHAEAFQASSKGPLLTPLPKATRSVSFDERVRAKKTMHLADFSEEELEATWYCEEEKRRIKRDVEFEANLLANDCLEGDSNKYCSRGLEVFTPSGSKQRSANKRRGRSLVVKEQELQREEGSNDQAYIAEMYAAAAAPCKANALAFAQQARLGAFQ